MTAKMTSLDREFVHREIQLCGNDVERQRKFLNAFHKKFGINFSSREPHFSYILVQICQLSKSVEMIDYAIGLGAKIWYCDGYSVLGVVKDPKVFECLLRHCDNSFLNNGYFCGGDTIMHEVADEMSLCGVLDVINCIEIMKMLIDRNVNFGLKNNSELYAIPLRALWKNRNADNLLKGKIEDLCLTILDRINLDLKGKWDNKFFSYVCEYGTVKIVKYLVGLMGNGINFYEEISEGRCCIRYCVDNVEVFKFLINECGFDVNFKNSLGKYQIDYAYYDKDKKIFIQNGARKSSDVGIQGMIDDYVKFGCKFIEERDWRKEHEIYALRWYEEIEKGSYEIESGIGGKVIRFVSELIRGFWRDDSKKED